MDGHRIEAFDAPHYRLRGVLLRHYRIVCPDGRAKCQCWSECQESHVCPDCGDDQCEEWMFEEDGVLTDPGLSCCGKEHQFIDGMICVREDGKCWMTSWDIEFDQQPQDGWPVGLYDFDMDDPDDAFGGTIFVTAMRKVEL